MSDHQVVICALDGTKQLEGFETRGVLHHSCPARKPLLERGTLAIDGQNIDCDETHLSAFPRTLPGVGVAHWTKVKNYYAGAPNPEMETTMRKLTVALAAAACALSLAACSSDSEKAQEATDKNNAALCKSLEGLQTELDKVGAGAAEAQATGDPVTVKEARSTLEKLGDSFNKVTENSQALSSSVKEQFDLAQQQYLDELSGIDENAPLSEASGEVQTAQQNLNTQYEQILSEVGCK